MICAYTWKVVLLFKYNAVLAVELNVELHWNFVRAACCFRLLHFMCSDTYFCLQRRGVEKETGTIVQNTLSKFESNG